MSRAGWEEGWDDLELTPGGWNDKGPNGELTGAPPPEKSTSRPRDEAPTPVPEDLEDLAGTTEVSDSDIPPLQDLDPFDTAREHNPPTAKEHEVLNYDPTTGTSYVIPNYDIRFQFLDEDSVPKAGAKDPPAAPPEQGGAAFLGEAQNKTGEGIFLGEAQNIRNQPRATGQGTGEKDGLFLFGPLNYAPPAPPVPGPGTGEKDGIFFAGSGSLFYEPPGPATTAPTQQQQPSSSAADSGSTPGPGNGMNRIVSCCFYLRKGKCRDGRKCSFLHKYPSNVLAKVWRGEAIWTCNRMVVGLCEKHKFPCRHHNVEGFEEAVAECGGTR
jgi:hypothetical protein